MFEYLAAPIEYLGNGGGFLTGLRCQRMELGEPDSSGRPRPVPIEGSEFEVAVDLAILAIGQSPNPLIKETTPEIETSRRGTLVVDPETMRTNLPRVYAGGDVVTGQATVILAMGAGRTAAAAIHEEMMGPAA